MTPASTWASPRTILALTDRRLLWLLDDAPVARVRTAPLRDVAEVAARVAAPAARVATLQLRMTDGRRHAFAELRPHTAATIERHSCAPAAAARGRRPRGRRGGLQLLGDHAPVAALGLGLEAQQGGGGRAVELAGERVERVDAVSSTCARNASRPSASRSCLKNQRMSGGVPSALRCS